MLDIFKVTVRLLKLSHNVISQGCIEQAHYPSSYSNWPGYLFSGILQLPFSSGAYPTGLEQLLKYWLGVWGALTPRVTNKLFL